MGDAILKAPATPALCRRLPSRFRQRGNLGIAQTRAFLVCVNVRQGVCYVFVL